MINFVLYETSTYAYYQDDILLSYVGFFFAIDTIITIIFNRLTNLLHADGQAMHPKVPQEKLFRIWQKAFSIVKHI